MKKTPLLLIAISLLFASCGKDPEPEWGRFYGFTQTDVVGHYEANPDESLYESLPTEGVVVYNNATLDVSAVGATAVSIHIVIPGKVNKTFSGPLDMSDENRSDIALLNVINTTNKEDLLSHQGRVNDRERQLQVRGHDLRCQVRAEDLPGRR